MDADSASPQTSVPLEKTPEETPDSEQLGVGLESVEADDAPAPSAPSPVDSSAKVSSRPNLW